MTKLPKGISSTLQILHELSYSGQWNAWWQTVNFHMSFDQSPDAALSVSSTSFHDPALDEWSWAKDSLCLSSQRMNHAPAGNFWQACQKFEINILMAHILSVISDRGLVERCLTCSDKWTHALKLTASLELLSLFYTTDSQHCMYIFFWAKPTRMTGFYVISQSGRMR